jgi:hypothetical protein
MNNTNFNTPILFLIFNRLDTTKIVFEEIKKQKPKQLFIAADGPRANKENENIICKEVRSYVLKNIDWNCEIKTLFRERNLGCGKAVSEAISWFFDNVEQGIILEDDCVPSQSFFGFCEIMLNKYKHDSRISMICGTNFIETKEDSYFFSNYYNVWGWATWKRFWNNYDFKMENWGKYKKEKQLYYLFHHKIASYYERMFNVISNGLDFWGIQLWYSCIFNNTLSIVPKKNLIKNIGLHGAHEDTQGDFAINTAIYEMNLLQIKHPKNIFPDKKLNELTYLKSHAQIKLDDHLNNEPIKLLIKAILKKMKNKLKILFS